MKKVLAILVIFIAYISIFNCISYADQHIISSDIRVPVHSYQDVNSIIKNSIFYCIPRRPQSSEVIIRILHGDRKVLPVLPKEQPKKTYEKIVNPYVPYSYEQMIKDTSKLKDMYPDLIKVESIGKSVEGRDIITIKLGKGNKDILFIGSHHAREYISTTFLVKMVDEYAYAYKNDGKFSKYDIKYLLDNVTFHFVPMLNPDGVNLVQNGIDSVSIQYMDKVKAMKMLQKTYLEWKANINGVDLNRQYPTAWKERDSNTNVPSSEMFKGYKPASEPEIKAIMNYTLNNNFLMAMSFHAKGEIIYWHDNQVDSYLDVAKPLAQRLSKLTGYKKGPYRRNPSIYGAGYENWFRQKFKRLSFCIELTPQNQNYLPHDDSKFDELVWNKGKYIGLFFCEEALSLY